MTVYFLVAAMIVSAIIANLLLKLGAADPGAGLASLLNWRVLLGLAMFASAAVLYLLVLRRLPLNVAQSFMATQFVGVILASYFVLGEAIPPLRIAGIALIALGVAIVGVSQA